MAGLFYLMLSVVALYFWTIDPVCISGGCVSARSWYLWGGLFYAVAGVLCSSFPKNRIVATYLAFGALFHAGLLWYGYDGCFTCVIFFAAAVASMALYWFQPEFSWSKLVSGASLIVLVFMVALMFRPHAASVPSVSMPGAQNTIPTQVQHQENAQDGPAVRFVVEAQGAVVPGQGLLQVTRPDGTPEVLDLSKKPALFFAVGCPPCNEALRDTAEMEPEKRPYLVVTYLRDGDAEKAKGKLAGNGLGGEVYYLKQKPPAEVQGVPAMTWWDGELKYVEGAEAIGKQLHSPKLL